MDVSHSLIITQDEDTTYTIDQVITAWLDAKYKRSRSEKTRRAYSDTLASFRAALQSFDLDVDSNITKVSLVAQGWAGQRSPGATREGEIAQSTYNLRLAILSSFYAFARKSGMLSIDNPIDRVERVNVEDYASAIALSGDEVTQVLAKIDRSTLVGKRDYALIALAVITGWRGSAIAALTWGNVVIKVGKKDTRMVITSPRMKGGKTGVKEISPATSEALLVYIHSLYGAELGHLSNNAPLWVSLSRNDSHGKQLSIKALEDVCRKHLGTGKFHTLRHTHALGMRDAGAQDSDIGNSLDHANADTMKRYLPKLKRGVNKYTGRMESMFGIEGEKDD